MKDHDPFSGPAPESVALPSTPLSGVLAQIRFEEILAITKPEFVSGFQERVRRDYPVGHRDESVVLALGTDAPQTKTATHWRFFDAERKWRITLTTAFLAVQTRTYTTRQDFISRLGVLLQTVEDIVAPSLCQRIGVRYVDRIHGKPLNKLGKLVRPNFTGFADSEYRSRIEQSIHEVLCRAEEGKLRARWGLIPENATHDAEMMPPIGQPSWMLDVDVFREFQNSEMPFNADAITKEARKFADRAYSFFRWAVTDAFLAEYGGEL